MSEVAAPSAASRVLVVVPVYNHGQTLASVVQRTLAVHPHVLVMDDGSTDLPSPPSKGGEILRFTPENGHPLFGLPVACLRHPHNMGKGAAILSAAEEARRLGMTHIITIDADGQHDPADLPPFLEAAGREPETFFVGQRDFNTANVPRSSRVGRAVSNFWFRVHTGEKNGDVQSGFRLYPLMALGALRCSETRYSFEVEVLVRASWAGFAVKNIPISVLYPPKEERISHFKSFEDNWRISLLNTRLTMRAMMPLPQTSYARDSQGRITALRPLRSLRLLLENNATPKNLALSAALGMAIGTIPLIGLQVILLLLLAGIWRLSKITGIAANQLCMPPFVPALCIEAGHYMRHGRFLTEISLQTLGYEALDRIWEWLLGSLVLAPIFALVCGALVFLLAKGIQKSLQSSGLKKATVAGGPS